jgi:hypothetical protein
VTKTLSHLNTNGALGWAPDFLPETAGQAVSEFIELFPTNRRSAVGRQLLAELRPHTGEWAEMLERAVQQTPT